MWKKVLEISLEDPNLERGVMIWEIIKHSRMFGMINWDSIANNSQNINWAASSRSKEASTRNTRDAKSKDSAGCNYLAQINIGGM